MENLLSFLIIFANIVYFAKSGNVFGEIFIPDCLDPDRFAMHGNKRSHIRLAGFIDQSLNAEGKNRLNFDRGSTCV